MWRLREVAVDGGWLFSPPGRLAQQNPARHGDVQAFDRAGAGNLQGSVGKRRDFRGDSQHLVPEDDHGLFGNVRGVDVASRVAGRGQEPETGALEGHQNVARLAKPHERNGFRAPFGDAGRGRRHTGNLIRMAENRRDAEMGGSAKNRTEIVRVLDAVKEDERTVHLAGRNGFAKTVFAPGAALLRENDNALVVDGLGEAFEVLVLDDVISPAVFGAPFQEGSEFTDAVCGDIDANNIVGTPREDCVAGMTAVKLLLVIAGAAGGGVVRSRSAAIGTRGARASALGTMTGHTRPG